MRIRLFGHYLHLPLVGLVLAEFMAFVVSMYAAIGLRLGLDLDQTEATFGPLLPRAVLFGAACLVSFLALGLYTTRQRAGAFGVGLRIAIAISAATAVVAALFYLLPAVEIGRGVLAIAALLSATAAIVIRVIAARVTDIQAMKKRVLVYGQSKQMAAFARMRRRNDRAGYHLVGLVHQAGDVVEPMGEQVYEAPQGLKALCQELNIDELVVAIRERRRAFPVKELLQCRLAGITVIEFISFMERETGRIQLDLLNPSWIIFGPGFARDGVRLFTARALDFVASALLVIVSSPIMLLAMLAIWLEDGRKGGGIFYRQNRVGFEGKIFALTKFRSMRVDAEAGGAQWAQKNDPRVTRVGAFMRKTRIDELPQLLNVLRGHMGFVGPRPERPEFVAELEEKIPYYAYRHSVKPGITGWAQLCYPYGSSIEDARRKLEYDLYYVKHHNLLLDLTILVQTVEVVLMGKGAR
jgi:sugar transferase (PEP-CTERM system associated)